MKKYAKKATALAMAAAMAVMAAPVYASEPSATPMPGTNVSDISEAAEVGGENTVVAPVYKVTLPTSMPFAIDAFQLLSPNALASKDFAIVNRSNVPVSVKASFDVTTANADITELDPTTALTPTTPTAGNVKQVKLNIEHASANNGGTINATTTMPKWTYLAAGNETKLSAQSTAVEFNFMLDEATYNADQKAISADTRAVLPAFNAAGFKITGDVSAYPKLADGTAAPWEAGDVTITATFTIVGQRKADFYTTETASATAAKGSNAATRTYTTLTTGNGTMPTLATSITALTAATISGNGTEGVITIGKSALAQDGIQYYKVFSSTADETAPATAEAAGITYRKGIVDGVDGWNLCPVSTAADAETVALLDADGEPVAVATGEKFYVMYAEVNAKGQVMLWEIEELEVEA